MSYSSFVSQGSMVFDEYRNSLYGEAIRKAITKESIVLDLGAGLGILGLIAAAAGAKRVYFVEPEPIVKVVKEIAKKNQIEDKVVIIQNRIEDAELPEKVDVILSVFTGNLLFSEDLLPSLVFARDKFLKPEGLLIPDLAELVVAPATATTLYANYIERWSNPCQGIDYSPARPFASNEILWPAKVEMTDAVLLSNGQAITTVDLTTSVHANCSGSMECHIERSGICHGFFAWIRIRIGDRWLSTWDANYETHWIPAFFPFDPAMHVTVGALLNVSLLRPERGDWTWSFTTTNLTQRHSTFWAKLPSNNLRKLHPKYRPRLNAQGRLYLEILKLMQAGFTTEKIISELENLAICNEATPKSSHHSDSRTLAHSLIARFSEK